MAPKAKLNTETLGIIDSNNQLNNDFDIIGKTRTSSFANIAEHIKNRLNIYGNLNTQKFTKKTGALNK